MPLVSQGGNIQDPKGSTTAGTGTAAMTYSQVENAWIQAGGNPQAAAMAAAIADSESGLNPNASRSNPDGTTGVGLWLLPNNGSPPGSSDPVANARAAIQLSKNGTDWTQWCTAWSDNNCGMNQGTYLGSGANALGSLGTQLQPSSYNMFGSKPSGDGVGASSAVPTNTPTPANPKSKGIILIVAILVAIAILVSIARHHESAS